MSSPLVTCVCPTYKRPQLLQNALACFLAQEYERKHLIILDDAGQFGEQSGDNWVLHTAQSRFHTLPAKYNALAELVSPDTEIIAVWEDDDVYLPHHLTALVDAHLCSVASGGAEYYVPKKIFSNYGCTRGETVEESAIGRFHGAWGFSKRLFDAVGGYPDTGQLNFDQQLGVRLSTADFAGGGVKHYDDNRSPSYIYRWGNGVYHGSQCGEDGFRELWDELGRKEAPYIGELSPLLDSETELLYARLA